MVFGRQANPSSESVTDRVFDQWPSEEGGFVSVFPLGADGSLIMSTIQLSQDQVLRSRKNYHFIVQKLVSVGNAPVAVATRRDKG